MSFSNCQCDIVLDINTLDSARTLQLSELLNETDKNELQLRKTTLKKQQFLTARLALRQLIYNSTGVIPQLRYSANRKPTLINLSYYCSISHSKNAVMVAVYNESVGIDIEIDKPRNTHNLQTHLNDFSHALPLSSDNFYQNWTRYEAALKLFGGTIPNTKPLPLLDESNFYDGKTHNYNFSIATQSKIEPSIRTRKLNDLLLFA